MTSAKVQPPGHPATGQTTTATPWLRNLPAALVALLWFAGYVKASAALRWIPIDLTLVAVSGLFVMTAAYSLRFPARLVAAAWPLTVLLVAFSLVFWIHSSGYQDDQKTLYLFLLTLPGAWFTATLLSSGADFVALAKFVVLGALGVAFLAVIAPTSSELMGRYAVAGTNTIAVGRATGAGMVAVVTLWICGQMRPRSALPILVPLLVVGLGSGSRGPVVAALCSLVIVVLVRSNRKGGVRAASLGATVVALGAWTFSRTDSVASDRFGLLFSSDQGESVSARETMWRIAREQIDHNFFGLGWGGLAPHLFPIDVYPHNLFLEVAAEGGLLAAAPLLFMMIAAFVRLVRRPSEISCVIVLGLFSYWTVNAQFSGSVNDNRALFALLFVGLIIGQRAGRQDVTGGETHMLRSMSTRSGGVLSGVHQD